jgi:hypothetical protein
VGYRNDEDGLRLRIAELEGELGDAEATIDRLRGEGASEIPSDASSDWFTGVPRQIFLQRELALEVTNEGLEAIAAVLDDRVPGGSLSVVGNTLIHRKASYELRLKRTSKGRTEVRLSGDYRALRLLLGLGGPGIGLLTGAPLAGVITSLGLAPPFVVTAFIVGALAGFLGLRALMRRNTLAERKRLTGMFEAVCDVAKAHAVDPQERLRFEAAQSEASSEAASEAQHAAETEAAASEEALVATQQAAETEAAAGQAGPARPDPRGLTGEP